MLPTLKNFSSQGQSFCPMPALTGGGKASYVSFPWVKIVCIFSLCPSSVFTFLSLGKNKDPLFHTWFKK